MWDFGYTLDELVTSIADIVGWVWAYPAVSIGLTVSIGLWVLERIASLVARVSRPRDGDGA